jgi:hypothetical protein
MSNIITQYYIYPAIGIARVGNSKEEFYIGPEAPEQAIPTDLKYKDAEGKVKRQAARFRVYGLNEQGDVVREVTSSPDIKIEWQVHLANRKSINYQFNNAMDLGTLSKDCLLRNEDVIDLDERHNKLLIDSGIRKIEGCEEKNKMAYQFDSGKFYAGTAYQRDVYLGELQTDEKGRLLVLGGRGESNSFDGRNATTFANNEGWHDDVSDGTVRATITIGESTYKAKPAMVVVTPPNFAPGVRGVVTMYDVVTDLFIRNEIITPSGGTQFYRDVYPIFKRLVDNQGVNSGFYMMFGDNAPANFTEPELLARLASQTTKNAPLRQSLFKQFRLPAEEAKKQRNDEIDRMGKQLHVGELTSQLNSNVSNSLDEALKYVQLKLQADQLPPFYGDAYGDSKDSPLTELSLTQTQYDHLENWAVGEFTSGDKPEPISGLDCIDVSCQPHALTKANLLECLGGPFHPGIELTWFLRRLSMWDIDDCADKMRLNILPEDKSVQDYYGPILTPDIALEHMFNTSGPGTLTRFMGVPWQTDEGSCRSGQDYDPAYYLPTPSFWSARVPNQVLSQRSLDRIKDTQLPVLQRLKHFDYRQDWLRFLRGSTKEPRFEMITEWDKIGIVSKQSIPPISIGKTKISSIWVESEVNEKYLVDDPSYRQMLHMESIVRFDHSSTRKIDSAEAIYEEKLKQLDQENMAAKESNVPPRKIRTRDELL